MLSLRRSGGYSLIELMVALAIVVVLAALLLPAIQKVRESANRLSCENNLRQIGAALHGFHEERRHFPVDYPQHWVCSDPAPPYFNWFGSSDIGVCSTFYLDLLPFVDEKNQVPARLQSEVRPVKLFLCPSRRSIEVGARCDYAHAIHPHASAGGGWAGGPAQQGWRGLYAIMGGIYAMGGGGTSGLPGSSAGIALRDVAKADGTSNTLILAHKGMEPRNYTFMGQGINSSVNNPKYCHDLGWALDFASAGAPDDYWADKEHYFDHIRYPAPFHRDRNGLSLQNFLSSPHAAMPCLFADGSLRHVHDGINQKTFANPRNGRSAPLLGALWGWNDGTAIDPD